MIKNKARAWPKPTSDEPVEHIRELDPAPAGESPTSKQELAWVNDLPTVEGLYLYQLHTEWLICWGVIKPGQWQKTQNPEWLYVGSTPLHELENHAAWYGPLPQPPNKVN
jgi:hypothetical protein